jgi:hypothetical protein
MDFIYFDGDHTLRGITMDLLVALKKVRPGGNIGGDDLTKTVWQHGQEFSPSMVFPYVVYWAEANNFPIWTLWNRQWPVLAEPKKGFRWHDHGGFKSLDPLDIFSPLGKNTSSTGGIS